MEANRAPKETVPRIVPTREHGRAICGTWLLDGNAIELFQEEGSGVLRAMDERGNPVNPITVISRGKKETVG